MTEVKGRTAFITGGANGIGLGIARAFAKAGAKLALADIDADALARAKAELASIAAVEVYELDVRDRDAYAAVGEKVEQQLGPVSLLFNNAGVAGGAAATKLTYEMWDWSTGINLHGVINGIQTFLPKMAERREGGHIVNTASGAGLAATGAGVLYTMAKYGVVGLSEALNPELSHLDIGVTVLCPGPVATDIVRRTAELTPRTGGPITEEQKARAEAAIEQGTASLAAGVSIDEVGDMVLKAVRANSLYIHTDRVMESLIQARTKALLEAMPS